MSIESDFDESITMQWAEILARSIEKKLDKYTVRPRLIMIPGSVAYVELGICERGKSILDEIHVAYAASLIQSMAGEDKALPIAKRVLREIRLRLGIPDEG